MSENQKGQSNQQSDSKTHLEKTQDGKKTTETNPNNPTANKTGEQPVATEHPRKGDKEVQDVNKHPETQDTDEPLLETADPVNKTTPATK